MELVDPQSTDVAEGTVVKIEVRHVCQGELREEECELCIKDGIGPCSRSIWVVSLPIIWRTKECE